VAQIRIDDQVLSAFCQCHHVRSLALFGSALRPQDFRPDSDIDVLVDFEPGHVPGFAFVDLADELSVLLARRVDLHTPASLSPEFRDAVLREAEVRQTCRHSSLRSRRFSPTKAAPFQVSDDNAALLLGAQELSGGQQALARAWPSDDEHAAHLQVRGLRADAHPVAAQLAQAERLRGGHPVWSPL
jgi:predicted nucleotidyltransferase